MVRIIGIIIMAVLLILAGCQTQDTLRIGGLFALTGAGSHFGDVEQKGAQLAVEELNVQGGINNKQLELISEDTRSDSAPHGVGTCWRKFITQKRSRSNPHRTQNEELGQIGHAPWSAFSCVRDAGAQGHG